jgi:hypothetical protein
MRIVPSAEAHLRPHQNRILVELVASYFRHERQNAEQGYETYSPADGTIDAVRVVYLLAKIFFLVSMLLHGYIQKSTHRRCGFSKMQAPQLRRDPTV